MASDGDIRVLLGMDLVLSLVFAITVVWGLSFVGVLAFSWQTVALATASIAFFTYLVVLR